MQIMQLLLLPQQEVLRFGQNLSFSNSTTQMVIFHSYLSSLNLNLAAAVAGLIWMILIPLTLAASDCELFPLLEHDDEIKNRDRDSVVRKNPVSYPGQVKNQKCRESRKN